MRTIRIIAALALAIGLGAAVYCCGPKVKPPVPAAGCVETCQHDAIGDYDCVCKE